MHIPAVDRPIDEDEWRSFVRAQGFGHLIATGAGRDAPVVIATQYVLEGELVLAHVAVANPILAALAERPTAMLAVAGDWAFIPSSWKAIGEEDPRLGIPTTYYAAVQLTCRVEVVADPDELSALLCCQLLRLQGDIEVAEPAIAHRARLAGIRGLRCHVETVEAKFKYGGNVNEAHRRAVLARLEDRGGARDGAAAQHLRRRIDGPIARYSAFRR